MQFEPGAPPELRLTRLTRAFAAIWCHQVDEKGARVTGAQSKLYLADPLLAWLGRRLRSGLEPPDFTRLTECVIGVSLARAIEASEPGRWVTNDSIGYLRTGGGNEIDFAPVPVSSPSGSQMSVPIEVKWVANGWRSESKTIEGKYRGGLVATRTILDLDSPSWAIPAPLLALFLE